MLPRAHAKNFSGARQDDDKEKICEKILLLRQKNNKSEILAGILEGARAGARQKFFREIFL